MTVESNTLPGWGSTNEEGGDQWTVNSDQWAGEGTGHSAIWAWGGAFRRSHGDQ